MQQAIDSFRKLYPSITGGLSDSEVASLIKDIKTEFKDLYIAFQQGLKNQLRTFYWR
jgi:hypothetical protein